MIPAILAGLGLFWLVMAHTHPTSRIGSLADSKQVVQHSERFITQWHFRVDGLTPHAVFKSDDELLAVQTAHFGKKGLSRLFEQGLERFIPSYTWHVDWYEPDATAETSTTSGSYKQPTGQRLFRTVHAPDGALQQFQTLHTAALPRFTAESIEHPPGQHPGTVTPQLADPFVHYLRRTVWNNALVEPDSAWHTNHLDRQVQAIRWVLSEPIQEHTHAITLYADTTGMLLQITQNTSLLTTVTLATHSVEEVGRILFYIAAFLGLMGLFLLRLSRRLIDLRSAGLLSLIAFGLGLLYALHSLTQSISTDDTGNQLLLLLILFTGLLFLAGLLAGLVFWLWSLAESLTREIWPGKLTTLGHAQAGYLFNRQTGRALLWGTFVGALMLLASALLYYVSDHSLLNALEGQVFQAQSHLLPTWVTLANGLFWMFVITAGLYGCLISWGALHSVATHWLLLAGSAGFALASPFHLHMPATEAGMLFWVLPGFILTYTYLRTDLLVTATAMFVFITLWSVASGVFPQESPDRHLAWIFSALMVAVGTGGWVLAEYGRHSDQIPVLTPTYITEIAREQRVERELEIARQVHASFLPPRLPARPGLDLAAHCNAAFDVGGDYYDVIAIDEHRTAFVIGDVSGKGIQAAFFMTMVKGFFQSLSREVPEPGPLLARINTLFYDNATRGRFITLCYGLFDSRDNSLLYARAGHNPAIFLPHNHSNIEVLRTSGMALGLTRERPFNNTLEIKRLELNTGDRLVFYTDGVTEAMNRNGQMYGEEMFYRFLHSQPATTRSGSLLNHIEHDIRAFTAEIPPADDQTMLVVTKIEA